MTLSRAVAVGPASASWSTSSATNPFVFALRPAAPLPQLDLSRTLAQRLLSDHWHRKTTRIVRNHFHHLVWCFRFGISCFVGLLFASGGPLRNWFLAAMVPANQSLIATGFFLSLDMLQLLVRSYDFWFLTVVNALNWVAVAAVLGDKRALASLLGWFAFQIVILVDSSIRTFPTSVNSMKLGIVIVLVLFGFVSLRAIDNANFFDVVINGRHIYDAADILGFTAFTLAIMQAKIIFLKSRKVQAPNGGPGFLRIPCAFVKATLRLDRVITNTGHAATATIDQVGPAAEMKPPATGVYLQQLKLSPLPMTHVDARRTLLSFRYWPSPGAHKSCRYADGVRVVLYTTGGLGYALSVVQTVQWIRSYMLASRLGEAQTCPGRLLTESDWILTQVAASSSIIFCSVSALFFQRDLLRLLATRNFDFIFSITQVAAFSACVVDMTCWERCSTLTTITWALWLMWALSTDALTPLANNSILRLPRQLPALLLTTVLLTVLGVTYIVLFLDNNGLRYRTIVDIGISSSNSFALTTRSVMLGRAATISLWSSRQVAALYGSRDGELHLIRGLVEFESPFGLFPAKINKHTPAFVDPT